jgi:hypothetical protein
MKLTNALGSGWIAFPSDLATAIATLDPDTNSFAVLERGDELYIQTAYEDGQLVVEKREGGADRHFRAWRMGGDDRFDKADVQRLFEAYYRNAAMPLTMEWRPYRLDGSTFGLSQAFRSFSLAKALVLVVLGVAVYVFTTQIRGALR